MMPLELTAYPPASGAAHLQLMRLVSPALPVGAYAYSQGLEYACEAGWVRDQKTAREWIGGLMKNGLAFLDAPVFARMYRAWHEQDHEQAIAWSRFLLASREASELKEEDRNLGRALLKLLVELEVIASAPCSTRDVSYALGFSLAATAWGIALEPAVQGYLWAWAENQVTVAMRLLPLGQTAGQKLIHHLITMIPECARTALSLETEQLSGSCPGLGIASALHETQYTRLFRS